MFFIVAGLGCVDGSPSPADDCVPACDADSRCEDGSCIPNGLDAGRGTDAGADDNRPISVTGITVTPAQANAVSVNGSRPMLTFTFTVELSDGTTVGAEAASFAVEPSLLGTFTATSGVFRASGRVGGDGRIIAALDGFRAEAEVHIELREEILIGETSTDTVERFDTPGIDDASRRADVVYPLDNAVMPQSVPPASIQWMRAAPGDAFRVTLRKPNVEVTAYFAQDAEPNFDRSWTVTRDAWRRITQTEPARTATLTVDRYEAASGEVIIGRPINMRFPKAALLGNVYYWDIERGRIVRIPDGSAESEEFMPTPPLDCVGCHTVSRDGRYMAGRHGGGDNLGGVYDLTADLTSNPPPSLYTITSTVTWWFSTWNPTGDRMMVSYQETDAARALRLMDPFTGRYIGSADAQLPTGEVTHPDWSPDGATVAYVGDANSWGGENTTGNVYILEVTGPDTFGASTQIVDGTTVPGPPSGDAASYPSFTPDAQRLAFAHGTSSRSENGQSALYIVNADGSGLVRLDTACGGVDTTNNFQPRFSPFAEGGFFWMSFLSRRDYGNELAGTRGTQRQQIWVSAIRIDAADSEDPSSVPYWLPGQQTSSRNISAYWAPRACRDIGETCGLDTDCCSGVCGADNVCDTFNACRRLGESCTASAQCCDDVLCIDDRCGGI